jgi:uncharacterized protein YbaP (TraB family)
MVAAIVDRNEGTSMLRRFLATLLLAILTLSGGRAQAGEPIWFYRAESTAGRVTYFYPSFHLRDERVPRPPESVLEHRSQLVIEADITQLKAHPETLMPYILNPKPVDLAAMFTPAELDAIRARAACNGMAPLLGRLRLFYVGMFVSLPCPKADSGTYEEVMAAAAKKRGLKVGALEDVSEQFAVMAALPDRLAIDSIKEYAGHPERAEQVVAHMIALYNAGKYDELYSLALQEGPRNRTDSKLFMEKLIVERNRHMVERMGGMLERGNALIVIGALHFPGKDGIVDLLRRQHYKVSEIDASSGILP